MKVKITFTLELDEAAQEAWMTDYGVERKDLREDVRRYFTPCGGTYPEMDLGVKLV